ELSGGPQLVRERGRLARWAPPALRAVNGWSGVGAHLRRRRRSAADRLHWPPRLLADSTQAPPGSQPSSSPSARSQVRASSAAVTGPLESRALNPLNFSRYVLSRPGRQRGRLGHSAGPPRTNRGATGTRSLMVFSSNLAAVWAVTANAFASWAGAEARTSI